MHQLIKAAAVAAVFTAASGTAFAASKTFEVEPFTAVEISSGINATVSTGGTQSVTAEAPDQGQLDELHLEVSGGTLKAYVDWSIFSIFAPDRQIKLTIAAPTLEGVHGDSGADVTVTGVSGDVVTLSSSSGSDVDVTAATGKRYDIDASSGSDLTVEGTCESAKVVSSSGSNVRTDKLLCADVDANASSGSDADVYASASIKVDASSGSDVSVSGSPPKVEQNASSGGDVHVD